MLLLRVRFTERLLLLHRGVFVCAHVTLAAAELNKNISKLETEQLALESRIEQQSQAYSALTDRLHAVVQENERKTKEIELRTQAHASLAVEMDAMAREHEQKTKEMDEAAQAALEETLCEIESLNQQLLEKGSSIASIKVTDLWMHQVAAVTPRRLCSQHRRSWKMQRSMRGRQAGTWTN